VNPITLLLVAAGGAIGSVLRVVVAHLIPPSRLPWQTITVNVAGSLLIGLLIARFASLDVADNTRAQAFWIAGVCGGFTTFSTFSWQTFDQLQKGDWPAAVANVTLSFFVCLAATAIGWRLAR
jgi:fluoride exporter